MRLSKSLRKKIHAEREIRLNVAGALEISEQAVLRLVERNSDNLTKYSAILYFKNVLGLSDDQIFEKHKVKSITPVEKVV